MPFFPETPVKRNMSKQEIAEVTGMLTEVLENMKLEIIELKTETKEGFESIENHMMNSLNDLENFKEWNTKSNGKSERKLVEKENHELKKKILELETSLKVWVSLASNNLNQQTDGTQRKEKQRLHKIQSKITSLVTIVLVLFIWIM